MFLAAPYPTGDLKTLGNIRGKPMETYMLGVGEKLPVFEIIGVKPGFNTHEENGESAFEPITQDSFDGKWKVIFFYPKDFTFVCPTEIVAFANIADEFTGLNAVVMGGSADNEFCKLAWRRDHPDLNKLDMWQFADTTGSLIDSLGIRSDAGVPYRATFIVDPEGVIQHVSVNNLNVGRNPQDTLRVLDGLQTDGLCPCNRQIGGETL